MKPFEKDGVKYAEHGNDGVEIIRIDSNNIPTSVTWYGKTRTVKCIGFGAIRGDFTSITIPNGIRFDGGAFANCTNLTSISVDDLDHVWKDGVLYSFDYKTIEFIRRDITSFVIPNSVRSIGNHAFCNCRSLTSITIPRRVKKIGNDAFAGCRNLKTLILPKRKRYSKNAFNGVEHLVSAQNIERDFSIAQKRAIDIGWRTLVFLLSIAIYAWGFTTDWVEDFELVWGIFLFGLPFYSFLGLWMYLKKTIFHSIYKRFQDYKLKK